ncbi:hypothetical protein DL93DRAFT_2087626 [Clavulina sp. PMI_390]|nr:hypothetical protein DL93DRAFT_2087626 [Clavulina sp. PMI_390]
MHACRHRRQLNANWPLLTLSLTLSTIAPVPLSATTTPRTIDYGSGGSPHFFP